MQIGFLSGTEETDTRTSPRAARGPCVLRHAVRFRPFGQCSYQGRGWEVDTNEAGQHHRAGSSDQSSRSVPWLVESELQSSSFWKLATDPCRSHVSCPPGFVLQGLVIQGLKGVAPACAMRRRTR